MAYRVTVDQAAEDAIGVLPERLRPALAEVFAVLRLVPWNGRPINAGNPDAEVRQFLFGPEGAGMLTYLILEGDRRVDVLMVHWSGD